MKALILSDVHSNICALKAVWDKENDSDIVICAGDLTDFGPFPAESVRWIREHDALCVIGNHDRGVISCFRNGRTLDTVPEQERGWKHQNAGLLGEEEIAFLESLPEALDVQIDGVRYGVCHGFSGYNTIECLDQFDTFAEETFRPAEQGPPPRLIFGHTHRLCLHCLGREKLWMNPGSISYRRWDDPCQKAHYITVADGEIALNRLDYDRSALIDEVEKYKGMIPERTMDLLRWTFGSDNREEIMAGLTASKKDMKEHNTPDLKGIQA